MLLRSGVPSRVPSGQGTGAGDTSEGGAQQVTAGCVGRGWAGDLGLGARGAGGGLLFLLF